MNRRRLSLLATLIALPALAVPSGHKWFSLPVSYRLANSPDNGAATTVNGGVAYATVVTDMRASFNVWRKTAVTSCNTLWDVAEAAQFSSPTGTQAVNGGDGQNRVIWIAGNWRYGSSTLGLTTTSFFPQSGQMTDSDMELNNANVSWFSGTAVSGRFDIRSVVTHEAGHFLGLDHTPFNSGDAVMNPSVTPGATKRTLRAIDEADVCNVYPGGAGGQGTACTTDANCTGGRVCRAAPGSTTKICTVACAMAGAACPPGYACQTADVAMACLPQRLPTDYCKFCSSGADCSTGNCITDGQGHNWCSTSCTVSAGCGSGAFCYADASGSGVCGPPQGMQCTGQCSGATGCAPGYGCTNGVCEPTGNSGDRCEVSGFCKPCNTCIGSTQAAYCRPCCGGQGAGGRCNACTPATCPSGQACQQVNGTQDQVCVPTIGADLCQACSAQQPCLNGAQCIVGRCHNACNPQSPGTCSACFDQGGTNGICACPDEISQAGQSCGVTGGGTGFLACAQGLACVGSPRTCRRTCSTSNPASCGGGEICDTVDGAQVCVPATAGAKCTPCNGTMCGAGLVCRSGRCYEPCNVTSASTCSTCVQTAAEGSGVCGCADEKQPSGSACGPSPVAICQDGLRCLEGFCRNECNVNTPNSCAAGLECRVLFSSSGDVLGVFCQTPQSAGGGSGASGGGTSSAGGGTASTGGGTSSVGGGTGSSGGSFGGGGGGTSASGGGNVTSQGCGCTSAAWLGWPALGVLAFRRRRARG